MSTTFDSEEVGEPAGPSPRDLLARFDRLSDDFGALRKELLDILVAGTPTLALLQGRRALECIVHDVYERRFREPAHKLDLAEMVDQLYKKGQIPLLIFYNAGYVRSLGNVGGHSKRGGGGATAPAITEKEVSSAVALLVQIVDWYVEAGRSGALDAPTVAREAGPSPKLPLSIVPKGLHSFDAGDAQFFLKLLPGPFHADGLPDTIHFWKERIEKEATFTVGVIYGRSGCGKSSLVKAGLLPRLADSVKRVYLESTTDDTEKELLAGLYRQVPKLPPGLDLKGAVEALQRRPAPGSKEKPPLEGKQKVFIVLDQFEQWLHAHRGEKDPELARALRQCDGDRVQALVSVRDDFWEAVSEFMEELHRGLKEGLNCRRVPLFEEGHARQVLTAFGRAYEKLGEEPTPEQEAFLGEVVENLSQDHRVICVRLALFAQMFQGKEWTPGALRAVGGTEGIGVAFLEETFSPSAETQKYSNHRDGAIAILKALLPEEGSVIKGRRRTAAELMEAAGYQGRPKDFAKLMGYLDSELRLITPTSLVPTCPGRAAGDSGAEPATREYQLTHDYLVPSLRKWLTRKLQETRRGRANLLLEARSEHWKNSWKDGRRDDRHMPTIREYLVIRALTRPVEWNDDQRTMMRHARNVHLRKVVAILATIPVPALIGANFWAARHAEDVVGTLTSAHIREVPGAIQMLAGYRRWADPLLYRIAVSAPEPGAPPEEVEQAEQRRLRAALALLPIDPDQLDYVRERLLNDPDLDAIPTLCQLLNRRRGDVVGPLWRTLEDRSSVAPKRFRAALALAEFARAGERPDDPRWDASADFIAQQMVATIVDNPGDYDAVLRILGPARGRLVGPLSAAFFDVKKPYHTLYASILAKYAVDRPEMLAALLVEARDPISFEKIYKSLEPARGRAADLLATILDEPAAPGGPAAGAQAKAAVSRKANAAVALIKLNKPERAWRLMRPSAVPSVRSAFIDRLSLLGADPMAVVERLRVEANDGARQALILALGEYRKQVPPGEFERLLPASERRTIVEDLEATYRETPDAGVRAGAEWLLRAWGRGDELAKIDEVLKRTRPERGLGPGGRNWFVDAEGQTLVVVPKAGSFKIGSSSGEPPDNEGKREPLRDATINYSFAIGAREVTLEEFLRFRPNHPYAADRLKPEGKLDVRCPVNNILWYDAAAYCNWLSERDGIPREQWCYLPNSANAYASGMRIADGFTSLIGYRMPTEAEWEYACRAGTITSRYYGESDELLVDYVWFDGNSAKQLQRVGGLKPNPWGLFDILGNVLEWCQDVYHPAGQSVDASEDSVANNDQIRVMRGEKMLSFKDNIRAARRDTRRRLDSPPDFICGFRIAQTYRP